MDQHQKIRLNVIIAAVITLVSLIAIIFGRSFQSQEIIYMVKSLSGGVLSFFSMILCVVAIVIYLIPTKRAAGASCIVMTGYSIFALICQVILLSRFSFAGALCCLPIIVVLMYTVVYWLSTYGMFKNSTPVLILAVCYLASICSEIFFAARYGTYFSTAFFVTALPTILYYVGTICYLMPNIKSAYVLRQERLRAIKSERIVDGYSVQDAPSVGFAILSFCFPIVGLILYCVWREVLPKRARSAGMGGLIGFIIGIVLVITMYGIIFS